MRNDLYFLSMVFRAYDAPDRRRALRHAFAEIQQMGQLRRYRRGYQQFLAFMNVVRKSIEEATPSGTLPVNSTAPDSDRLDRSRTPIALPPGPGGSDAGPVVAMFENLKPGTYEVIATTGMRLWMGELGKADLLWSHAQPGKGLPLAADTTGTKRPAQREITLLDGWLVMRSYAGLEAGTVLIAVRDKGSGSL